MEKHEEDLDALVEARTRELIAVADELRGEIASCKRLEAEREKLIGDLQAALACVDVRDS